MKPDEAAMPLEMPIKVPAYCGAISMWLTKYPEKTHPLTDTATVSRVTANAVCEQSRKPSPINNTLGPNDPTYNTIVNYSYIHTIIHSTPLTYHPD